VLDAGFPTTFVCCRVPHPNQPKLHFQQTHLSALEHDACRTTDSSKFDENPNDSERMQVQRLALFFQHDKNYARQ